VEIVNDIAALTEKIAATYIHHDKKTSFSIGVSGIDASGKGYIIKLVQKELETQGYKVANINIDPWQNPIPVRLQKENAVENFNTNVYRWNDFFEQLIVPLKNNKGIYLVTNGICTDADVYYSLVYDYREIDIILIDGILLFQEKYLSHFDYKIWVDCTFEKGLERAINRNVEKLDEKRLIHDYETYYHAAQRLHFERDDPKIIANVIFDNN
jgi:uridine kinase